MAWPIINPKTSIDMNIRGSSVLKLLCLVILAAGFVELSSTALAQGPDLDPSTSGTYYVVAYPDTASNLIDSSLAPPTENTVTMSIYSAVNNRVRITGPGYTQSVNVDAGTFTVVNLLDSVAQRGGALVTSVGAVSNRTFSVEAEQPIVLYCAMMNRFGGEAWAPIPVDRWGGEYYAAALPCDIVVDMYRKDAYTYARKNTTAPSLLLIVAAYDSTHVVIAPNGRLENYDRTTVTLNRGQAYTVESYVDTNADRTGDPQVDLGGSRITADRPIGVITGNTRVQVVADRPEITNNSLKNMAVEWLAPADQYGTDFVWMPTWDTRHLTGIPGEKVAEKRTAEFARVYGANDATTVIHTGENNARDTGTVGRGRVQEYRVLNPRPHRFTTSKPAQVMMHSSAVVKYNGTISGQPGSQSYDSWGPYMAEVVSREQWSTFAPFHAPTSLYETRHYVNVVADTTAQDLIYDETGAPFDFNGGQIPGTPYMWGTIEITPGKTHYLQGREGTRFCAVQYGLRQGLESYRPEVVRQTFAEYRELIGRSYGFPLAPRRSVRKPADVLKIDRTDNECEVKLTVRITNQNPSGLLSARFAPGMSNARVVVTRPAGINDVAGMTSVDLSLQPVDPRFDATGTLRITDRTGALTTVPYQYLGSRVVTEPATTVDFGELTLGGTRDSVVVVTNPLDRPVRVNAVQLRSGAQSFSILSTAPPAPVQLAPGERMSVRLRSAPISDKSIYRDTLRFLLACGEVRLPLQTGPIPACIWLEDLNFDTLDVGERRTLELRICNIGHGQVTFSNPGADSVLAWLGQRFTVSPSAAAALKAVSLGPGQCIGVPVTFSSPAEGTFQTIARVWASSRGCRDTSLWRAVVVKGHVQGVESASRGVALL